MSSIIQSRNYPLSYFIHEKIDSYNFKDSSLIIIDMLDVTKDFVNRIKKQTGCPIISFENTGESIEICDLTFNPIYKLGFSNQEGY